MSAYYNENDPFAAAWLRNLIAAGHLPLGDVDERSIVDVRADDLRGYRQHHFFAGIGGWAYALKLAGWDAARPVWTGSCPCQPFSSAGRQGGALDERHLWPWWFRLIRECRPDAVFGEQVEGAVGFGWVDRVFADLEEEGYACGAAVLGAHSLGAPHIRQRLFWVAQSSGAECGSRRPRGSGTAARWAYAESAGSSDDGWVADADAAGSGAERRQGLSSDGYAPQRHDADGCGEAGGLAHSRLDDRATWPAWRERQSKASIGAQHRGAFWSDAVWLPCLDGKARRTQRGIFPLATRLPAAVDGLGPVSRVGALKGAGNSIVPQVAAEFISAFMECLP